MYIRTDALFISPKIEQARGGYHRIARYNIDARSVENFYQHRTN